MHDGAARHNNKLIIDYNERLALCRPLNAFLERNYLTFVHKNHYVRVP